MVELRHFLGIDNLDKDISLTLASGPVIIKDGKVLLDKHGEDKFWKFPGGALKTNLSLIENAKKEVKEELGLDVEISDEEPVVLCFEREYNGKKEFVVLFHYLGKIKKGKVKLGEDVREYTWRDIDNLKDCAPNIKPVVEKFRKRM